MSEYFDADLPTTKRALVRVAESQVENTFALAQHGVWSAARTLNNVSDESLVALMLEPEFYADCSGLEQELIVRLASRLELERNLVI